MTSASLANNGESKIKDYISLLKPRVMSLVVFTGFAGMALAPGEIHPLIAAIAIICIAFGSGAAGAINMWYERDVDAVMNRTKNRPLPANKLHAENAIEFAILIAAASVFTMSVVVNFVAGAILLTAILFYVFIYTIWLKRKTPQNIVIGGAAGAFPPMIGWAAVTGGISIESTILFTIIFLWTPPHFWALALYKNEDYKLAGIPMMPVVAGSQSTRKQMFIYTVLLLLSTLLPLAIGMFGAIYAVGATLLGIKFLYYANNLYHEYSETMARSMFKYSIFYLFALFVLMIIDKAFL